MSEKILMIAAILIYQQPGLKIFVQQVFLSDFFEVGQCRLPAFSNCCFIAHRLDLLHQGIIASKLIEEIVFQEKTILAWKKLISLQ